MSPLCCRPVVITTGISSKPFKVLDKLPMGLNLPRLEAVLEPLRRQPLQYPAACAGRRSLLVLHASHRALGGRRVNTWRGRFREARVVYGPHRQAGRLAQRTRGGSGEHRRPVPASSDS